MKAAALLFVLCSAQAFGQSAPASDWKIAADADRGIITVSHPALGAVLEDARLNVRTPGGLAPVSGWSVRESTPGRLVIRTENPRAGWRIEAQGAALVVSSTAAGAVLTASVPTPKQRIVARLIDRSGTPVNWIGTQEVQEGYGGAITRNASFLPRRNPDVLYFALGAIAGAEFHSLFDRRTDTAIDFGPESSLKQERPDASSLDLALPIGGNATIRVYPDYFTRELGVPYYAQFDDRVFDRAPMVWSSWTSYYEAVTERDIVANADWLAANLKPYGFQYVQLDDGYDRGLKREHYWIENWDKAKFPHGPQWLTSYIRSKGLKAGIWLVPNAYAGAVQDHPDWYLRDKTGKIILDYSTPSLDSTHPDALALVRRVFSTLDDWGFDYYKLDGEHALPRYVPAADRYRLHDPNADLLVNYRKRIQAIRDVIGPNRFIEGCPAGTPLNGIGYFNSYFTGHDLYNTWAGMYPLFSSINANVFLNHLLVYVMPGEGLELGLPMSVEEAAAKRPKVVIDTARTRETPLTTFGLTDPEARTLVTYVALTGVAYPLASVMSELPAERVKLLKATMPTMPILPVDLFSRGTDMLWNTFQKETTDSYIHNYPEILDLKVNTLGERYDVVALTNWRSTKATRTVPLVDQLGLEPDRSYVAFDFWNQKPLGPVRDRLDVEVEPHDTRVIAIRPLVEHPQVIGISRHISGAYSIVQNAWDGDRNELRGVVEAPPGDSYDIWVNVPGAFKLASAKAVARGGREIPVQSVSGSGGSVMIRFPGQPEPVEWSVRFARR